MCACGSVSSGNMTDAAASIDAPATPRCNPDSPFGARVPISEINTGASEEGSHPSPRRADHVLLQHAHRLGRRFR